MGRSQTYLAVLAAACGVTVVLIGASLWSASRATVETRKEPAQPGLFTGIPQHSLALGDPTAPVTLVEYADLQCPYCAAWATRTLPVLVSDYVRTGRLRIVFHGLAFVGPDSGSALTAAVAAGRQNHLWDVVDGLYQRQGAENSGWFTPELLADVVGDVPGLDAVRLERDRQSGWTGAQIDAAGAAAQRIGIQGTPSFELGPTGGPLRLVGLTSIGPEGLRPAIDSLLADE
jgi:protein-disulfide isomerase